MSETVVRMALVADEDGIMALLIQNHAENGQHEFCEPKVRQMVRRALYQQGGIIGVVGTSDDIRGSICLLIDEVWYSEERQILELWNYVRQDSRKFDYAKKMIEFAKKCADGLELDLTIGVLSDNRMASKCELYARQLPKAGEFFVYRKNAPIPGRFGRDMVIAKQDLESIGRGNPRIAHRYISRVVRNALKGHAFSGEPFDIGALDNG